MTRQTKIQKIKLFIKASIIIGVLSVLIVLGIFVRPGVSFESAHMKKWLNLNEQQRILTINRVIKDTPDQELLVKCVNKIAGLPDSDDMLIRDAIVICNSGIQANINQETSTEENQDEK